jgi:hypothetical protein
MLTDPKLRSQVDSLWDKFWTGSTRSKPNVAPLDMFGADAAERWFTEKEINEVVAFTKKFEVD